ncbi:MAG: flagellar basal body P-ring formation chaperone FlgA [Telluria sp.]
MMRPRLCVLLACALALPVAVAAPARVDLRAAALASGARVTLADVAATDGLAPELAALDLGPAPLPGHTLRLARAEVARVLRQHALAADLGGAQAVVVERRAQALDLAAAARLAEAALRAHAGEARLELQALATPTEVALPLGAVTLAVRPLPADAARRARVTVWLDAAVDGQVVRTFSLGYQVRAWRGALVAGRAIAAGAPLRCADFAPAEVDAAALASAPVVDCAGVRGRARRAIAAGEALQEALQAVPPAVADGDSVRLRYAAGAIELESRATALADAAVGQAVDVRPAGANQAVRALVAAPGLVSITER